jgi:hypothetical protein|nr:MAG TPA: hypothetical protein [Caudoviricetes sp.]
MVRFENISTTEKNYPYVDAVVAADYKNGTFGTVATGTFTAGATGNYVIMNIEDGDDAKSDDYVIKKGAHARIADLETVIGAIVDITSAQLPASVVKGNKLQSQADGTLKVNASATGLYIEVVEVTRFGVVGKIVKTA